MNEKVNKKLSKNALKYIICGSIALLVVLVDCITKILAVSFLEVGEPVKVLGEFLVLDLCFNKGIAFGQMQVENTVILGLLSLVMSCGIGFLIYKFGDIKLKPIGTIAFALMLGGAFGNMIDRFFGFPACFYGEEGVVDFVNTNHIVELISNGRFTWGVWNIADAMLCIGTAMLAVHIIFFEKENKKVEQKPNIDENIIDVEAEVISEEIATKGEEDD